MSTTPTATTHVFEQAGLGRAPFRYVGHEDTRAGQGGMRQLGETPEGIRIETTPGGTCEFCGTAIMVLCFVEDADGRRFHVGRDCVAKTGDAGLRKAVDKDIRDRRKAKKVERERARIEAARESLAADASLLTDEPHPTAFRAEQGDTKRDYCEWLLANAGHSGKVRVARMVEAAQSSRMQEAS